MNCTSPASALLGNALLNASTCLIAAGESPAPTAAAAAVPFAEPIAGFALVAGQIITVPRRQRGRADETRLRKLRRQRGIGGRGLGVLLLPGQRRAEP